MNRNFSENLRKIRKENNLSQEQLAEELGVSRQAISKWESGAAYPEMDKIIAICEKFNVNIDDLLHKDIKEVKGEEESKKKINTMIDDFLKFITNTINFFSNLSFKSKMKCIFEQVVIAVIMIIISSILIGILSSVFSSILSFLPNNIQYFILHVLQSIMVLFCVIAAIIIITHVFKTRYLNYYTEKIEESKKEETKEEIEEKDNTNEKVELKKESKIVIRDPEHSEYHLLNGLWKVMVIIMKFFALCIALGFAGALLGLGVALAVTFLFIQTGFIFLGSFISLLSSILIVGLFLLILLNFVFNRKGNKKLMIYTFIISVLAFGLGCGIFAIGCTDFELIEDESNVNTTKTIEMDMNDNLYLNFHHEEIEYIPSDNTNIKIEYETSEYCEMKTSDAGEYGVSIWYDCTEIPKMFKDIISDINHKKIHVFNNTIQNIKVYTTQENINKMNENKEKKESLQEQINSMRDELSEKDNKIQELENKIEELE